MSPEVVGEQIICQSGSYRRVRRWLKGTHPALGQIVWGHTGWETYQETDVLVPMEIYTVSNDISE